MIQTAINAINSFLYNRLLIILLIGAGLYFTIRTKLPQIRLFGEACRAIMEKPEDKKKMSSFQALMVSTASRVGTGNIIGVSSAICIGGFGSVFWMWIIAIIGSASAMTESTLAQIYKKRGADGSCYGGPAYYIEAALHSRPLAILFCISMIATYAFGFNMLASYNLQSTFSGFLFYDPAVTPWIIGGILAVLAGWCLLGGGSRIVKVTSTMVPFMGIAYILVSFVVIGINASYIPTVFRRIFEEAFDFRAIFGGFAGSAMMQGIRRGLYSNEAGIGSAPNASASASVSHPIKQGLVQMISVFIDTLLLCTATAMMGLSSGIEPTAELQGAPWIQAALQESLGSFGPIFLTVSMIMFAFTTLLGNCFYCDNLLAYIHKKVPSKRFMNGFRLVCAAVVFIGAGMEMDLLWNISDVLMGVMALINIPVLLLLSGTVKRALTDFEKQRRTGKNPVFYVKNINLKQETDFWK
ncbi:MULTISPECIES: alanine/glycine:cation symporter family protein [unclassified Candidatus Paralachnospira]|uniref:alanine/glycine:cation symporter family protein n=1 Tax=unclassified Candidatus Paralachnospira TaxID=3099471 RepID=UPI003F9300C4